MQNLFRNDVHLNVSKVLSGDTLVLRGKPVKGPPAERTLSLAFITAPRLGRRTGDDADADEVRYWDYDAVA